MLKALGLLMLACVTMIPACSTTQPRESIDPLAAAPADFSLDVTVLTGTSVPPSAETHRRPSRYVLFADGSLHSSGDQLHEHGPNWLPPLTRILSRQQVSQLWSRSQELGFTDEAADDTIGNFKLVQAQPNEIVYLAGFSADGRHWSFIRRDPSDQPSDPAMTELVRQLAQLAWANVQDPSEIHTMPKRYDFGPDPYARYRKAQK